MAPWQHSNLFKITFVIKLLIFNIPVLEDSVKALHQLKSDHKHIEIGAISNFDNRLHDVVPSLGLKQYFDFIVTSEDAKSSKPEAAIFDYAASRCTKSTQLLASEILHVGDDMDKENC